MMVGKRGMSLPLVVFLCGSAFLAGRLLHTLNHLPPNGQEGFQVVTQQHQQEQQQQPVEINNRRQDLAVEQPHVVQQPQQPTFTATSFDEALQPLLADHQPLKVGESGRDHYITQPMQQLSWYPRIYVWPKFLSPQQCKQLIEVAEPRLAPSELALRKGETEEGTKNIRTSQGTFMAAEEDPSGVLDFIEEKVALLTGLPRKNGESFNLLRYNLYQHYDSHYDYFEESGYGKMDSNRMATVLVYLSDVEEGGETVFPLEGRTGLERLVGIDYKSCDVGFKYKPRVGDALLFYSMYPNNTLDQHSLHGGCPVIKGGPKWVATKWIRNKCYSHCNSAD